MVESLGELEQMGRMEKKSESGDMLNLRIPKTLADRIQLRLAKSDFKTIDDYATYILDQVLTELETGESVAAKTEGKDSRVFSKEDQESVEQRLRDLGYL